MAKSRCTRREKAEEIADFLFTNRRGKHGARMHLLDPEDIVLSRWLQITTAEWIEIFLRGWHPTPAPRRKKTTTKARKRK